MKWWDDVYGFDMSCIRKTVIREPTVEEVDPRQVVTTNCAVKEVDLYTVKLEDLTFKSEFKLKAKRDDYIHYFITYFDVGFTKCHRKMGFSTSPECSATNWKQMIFFLDDYLVVKRGEEIVGTFQMTPNPRNKRQMDFNITVNYGEEPSDPKQSIDYKMG